MRPAARSTRRVIEVTGLSGTGKTTVAATLAARAPDPARVGARARFKAPLSRHAYFALMLRHAPAWWSLYRVLRAGLPGPAARRRLRMYIKHLWRRRQQIRSRRTDLVIEDEAFATWFARDLERIEGMGAWLERYLDRFYPRQVGRHRVEYLVLRVECAELLRVLRVHRRRLERGGPAYAVAELARHGTFASRGPAMARVEALLLERGRVLAADAPGTRLALGRDPLAAVT